MVPQFSLFKCDIYLFKTLPSSCYCLKVRKNSASCVFLRWLSRKMSSQAVRLSRFSRPGEANRPDMFPESLSSCGGRKHSHRRPRVPHLGGAMRAGSGIRRGLRIKICSWRTTGKPSRFSSEIGTKTDAKQ